jgi:hypothetical protein
MEFRDSLMLFSEDSHMSKTHVIEIVNIFKRSLVNIFKRSPVD